jgi:hypothetical protein
MSIKTFITRLFEDPIDRMGRESLKPFICPDCGKLGKYLNTEERKKAIIDCAVILICPNNHQWVVDAPLLPTKSYFVGRIQ